MNTIFILPDAIVKTKLFKLLIILVYKIYESLRYRRSLYENKQSSKRLESFFKDLTVREGFMKGLKYPDFISYGSSIFPKLSGTYENELNSLLLYLNNNNYESIIDIGCAEGFYAVGLAKRFESAVVWAFDISEVAQQLCKKMAVLNNVSERVNIKHECTASHIKTIIAGQRALIVCDCEGYERYLFNFDNYNQLLKTDLIIELHPMYEKDVKDYLYHHFSITHNIHYITSFDDRRKIFELPELFSSFSTEDKIKLVQEGRDFSMDWMIALAKNV